MTISIVTAHRSLLVATILAVFAALGPASVVAKEASVAERLQLLEDKEEIRALLERYFEFQESRNFDAFANLFSKDGELILRRGRTSGGPAGIKAGFTRQPGAANADGGAERGGGANAGNTRERSGANAANAPARSGSGAPSSGARDMRHILSNVHIVVTGDTATAMSRWTLLSESEDKRTRVGGTGRYDDKLVRENGAWKFQRRVLYRDLPADPEGNPKL
jgi:hypothetical protein